MKNLGVCPYMENLWVFPYMKNLVSMGGKHFLFLTLKGHDTQYSGYMGQNCLK